MKIIGTGSVLPKRRVSNEELAGMMDTSDEWIRTRTGIGMRHIAVEETTASMSVEAAAKAMEAAGIRPEELDLILGATASEDYVVPSLACEVQAALGAQNAVAFDVCAACSGFLFALATAEAYFGTGRFKRALVIGAETLSKIIDWEDRGSCVLFGDGAGAVVLSAEGDNFLGMVQGSNGAEGMVLRCKNRPNINPFMSDGANVENAAAGERKDYFVHMEGQAVYKFAVRTVPKAIAQALEEADLTAEDVDYFILHQANLRIIEAVAHRMGQPMEKFPTNLQECGNVSAASVPILLDETVRKGLLKPGNKIVLAGFGGGLTWGACVLEW